MYHHLATAESEDYQVTHILCDGEKGFTAFFNALRTAGYFINPAGPGQHVPVVERKIRVVKECLRIYLQSISYQLMFSLLRYLAEYVTIMQSLTPKGKTLQAHMNYSEVRRSIINDNYEYHSTITRNAMTHMLPQIPWSVEQTRALLLNAQGSHLFYNLETRRTCFQQTS